MDTEVMIGRIEEEYNKIVRLYKNAPVEAITDSCLSNGWSVKDLIAHLAAWEWRCASLLEVSHNTDAPLHAMPDVDALNREIYQERIGWSWQEVEYDFQAAHVALISAIGRLPAARLNDEFVQQTIAEETWNHYRHHLPELQRWHRQLVHSR